MNVTVENLAPCRKLMRVDVDAQAVDAAFAKVASEFQRQVRLPGFRPGKAPLALVTRLHAKSIEEEVKRKLISDSFKEAAREQKLDVVGQPDIEEIQFARGQPLQFAATIETAPDFELPDYKGLPVKLEMARVSEEDVQRALLVLREQRVEFKDVARPAQAHDIAVVNYQGTCEGKPLTDLAPTARGLTKQSNFWVELKAGSFVPGFAEQLAGAQAGDRRTVTVDFPADFVTPELSGKKGVYEVEIVQVKERVLPELNDELAKAYGAESLEKLLDGVRRDLENELKYKQSRSIRDQLIRTLLGRVQFELPESIVLSETKHVIYDVVRENQQRGVTKEVIDRQKDEIYSYASNSAKERVKIAFLLGRIADKEQIKVDKNEITQRILFLAHQNQIKPEKFVKQLQERGGIVEIHEQILSNKTLNFLEEHARLEEVLPGSVAP
ncbi:MAG: trigger factor [Chloroflexi bacterium]|nr:trigger factor [Chloroflexota bacterium]